jgi:hypothetical protein
MNLLSILEISLVALGLALFAYGKVPGRDAERDALVRGAGLVLTLPAAMGLVVRFILRSSGMGPGATILAVAIFAVSLLVCVTLSVLLCASAGGSHRGPSAA